MVILSLYEWNGKGYVRYITNTGTKERQRFCYNAYEHGWQTEDHIIDIKTFNPTESTTDPSQEAGPEGKHHLQFGQGFRFVDLTELNYVMLSFYFKN